MAIFSIRNIVSGARVLKVQRPGFATQVDFNYQVWVLYAIPIAATKKIHVRYVKTTIRKE